MIEAIIVKVVTSLLIKLFTWLGGKAINWLGQKKFESDMREATKDAIEKKDPRKLEDMLSSLGS